MGIQQYPVCPKCGNRLFLESLFEYGRFHYFWKCSVGCSREYKLGEIAVSGEFVDVVEKYVRKDSWTVKRGRQLAGARGR